MAHMVLTPSRSFCIECRYRSKTEMVQIYFCVPLSPYTTASSPWVTDNFSSNWLPYFKFLQASQAELGEGLRMLGAVQIGERWRLVDEEYLGTVLELVISRSGSHMDQGSQ